jgi:hypothetical protein
MLPPTFEVHRVIDQIVHAADEGDMLRRAVE